MRLTVAKAMAGMAVEVHGLGTHWSGHGTDGWGELGSTTQYASTCPAPTTTSYSTYTYTALTTSRYATPLASPLTLTTTYAPAFSEASKLLPGNVTTTTYSLNPNATATNDGPYGQSAYAALWTGLSYNTTIPFTTTLSPTPVPSSELIYPPALPYVPVSAGENACYKLPKDFIWGVAGSAWQIEGGLKYGGRGPSTIDYIGSLPNTAGVGNAEVANMNYFLYKQDIARLAALGIPYYSFSVAPTRIVPFGTFGSPVNLEGLQHYDDVIKTCLEYGIAPIVTLQHFDASVNVPQGSDGYPEAFLYYAKQVMTHFGDRVQYWATLNEPNLSNFGGAYAGATNTLLAHAKVYHWYKEVLKGTGKITIKFANNLALPLDGNNEEDHRAVKRYQDYILGTMANPIFLGEQYPAELLNTTNLNLTALTPAQLSYINGTADFWSFDPYVSQYATSPPGAIDACAASGNASDPLWPACVTLTNVQQDGWPMGQASFAYAYLAPQYVRQQIGYIWNTFKPSGILISEFGFNPWDEGSKELVKQRYDLERTLYYQGFLTEMLKSIWEDGANVIGALGWSVMDNNEFGAFDQQYGMQAVNRTNGEFTRTYKRSIFDFVDFFHNYVEK